jgi:hypothetical protein
MVVLSLGARSNMGRSIIVKLLAASVYQWASRVAGPRVGAAVPGPGPTSYFRPRNAQGLGVGARGRRAQRLETADSKRKQEMLITRCTR